MKTIGLIGGTGWVSTQEYYKLINERINNKLGGLQFPTIIIYSVNYGEIYACNQNKDRDGVIEIIKNAATTVQKSGAEFLALCANTIHFTYDSLIEDIHLPFVHIADVTGNAIKSKNINKVGLLGTRDTMKMDFYKKRLAEMSIEVLTPEKKEQEFIHSAIMNELLKERFLIETKKKFISIMNNLRTKGANGIILGCTEIPLLINQADYDLPLFSTLQIHAEAIADFAISTGS